jgi:hypothetical protein
MSRRSLWPRHGRRLPQPVRVACAAAGSHRPRQPAQLPGRPPDAHCSRITEWFWGESLSGPRWPWEGCRAVVAAAGGADVTGVTHGWIIGPSRVVRGGWMCRRACYSEPSGTSITGARAAGRPGGDHFPLRRAHRNSVPNSPGTAGGRRRSNGSSDAIAGRPAAPPPRQHVSPSRRARAIFGCGRPFHRLGGSRVDEFPAWPPS